MVTDWAGDPEAVFVSGDILAGTPAWHAAMLEIVCCVTARSRSEPYKVRRL